MPRSQVIATRLAARSRLGTVVMTLALPMVGVGLSYTDVGEAAALAGLMVLGSLFAYAIGLLWPESAPRGERVAPPVPAVPVADDRQAGRVGRPDAKRRRSRLQEASQDRLQVRVRSLAEQVDILLAQRREPGWGSVRSGSSCRRLHRSWRAVVY